MIDYTLKTELEISIRAKESLGLSIKEIIRLSNIENKKINIRNKGNVGNIIEEYWFGIKNNNSTLPDFQQAGIELKVIPLIEKKENKLSVKERTKVCSINYNEIINETWESSHAKNKLNKILFIYYVYNKNSIEESIVKKIDLFELKKNDEIIIKNDWERVYCYVDNGKAHELSETISSILAASRSGSGGKKKDGTQKDLVSQPKNEIEALKRAFSLKQSFTNQRWNELNRIKYESIIELLNNPKDFEKEIINKLLKYSGLTLGEIATKFNIKVPNGKNSAATIVKKAIGFKNVSSRIKEFEQLGITVKTVNTRSSDYYPWEAVSFPTFKLKELVVEYFYEGNSELNEEWDKCTLLNHINRILFIPIIREKGKGVTTELKVLGKPFFWSPSFSELKIIEKEWENYISEIKSGKVRTTKVPHGNKFKKVSSLSKESDTKIIHMRPHGKDGNDEDIDHLGNKITKQCFWLNKRFLQKLLIENNKK